MTISSAFQSAASGLNAAVAMQSAASANLANVLTPNYRRLGVAQATLPDGGVTAKIFRGRALGPDPVLDVAAEIGALYSLKANILSLKMADRMAGTILNVRA